MYVGTGRPAETRSGSSLCASPSVSVVYSQIEIPDTMQMPDTNPLSLKYGISSSTNLQCSSLIEKAYVVVGEH